MPRKKTRRNTSHPGIYDRGTYWQVRIRFTAAGGVRQELENYRAPYDPDAATNSPDHKKRALERAIAYAAAEKKSLHQHGEPRIKVAEQQTLADWLRRWESEVLDPIEREAKADRHETKRTKTPTKIANHRVPETRKGWQQEKSVIAVLLSRHAVFCSRRITELGADDFCGREGCLAGQLRGQGGGPAAPATIRRHLAVISAVYRRARSSWGFAKIKNPIHDIDGLPPVFNERNRVIKLDEFAKVLFALLEADPATQAAIQFLRWTACRRSEAVNLRWENVMDWATGEPVVTFKDTKTPKLGEKLQRHVMLSAEAVDALAPLLSGKPPPVAGWVFPSPTNASRPLRADSLTQAWIRARNRAGFAESDTDAPRLHDLRHTRTTEISKYMEGLKTMKITGHRDPRTLARYYHPDAKELGRMISKGQANESQKLGGIDLDAGLEQMMKAVSTDPELRRRLLEKLMTR